MVGLDLILIFMALMRIHHRLHITLRDHVSKIIMEIHQEPHPIVYIKSKLSHDRHMATGETRNEEGTNQDSRHVHCFPIFPLVASPQFTQLLDSSHL